MYQIQLKFKGQSKKITVAKSLQTSELQRLIAQCFNLNERVVGVTNKSGCFLELAEFNKSIASSPKESFALVTAKDVNQDSMSFGTPFLMQLHSTTSARVSQNRTLSHPCPSHPTSPPAVKAALQIWSFSSSFACGKKAPQWSSAARNAPNYLLTTTTYPLTAGTHL